MVSLVLPDKIFCRWVKKISSNEGKKMEHPSPLKRRYFTAIGLSSVKKVADRRRHAAYHNKHW